MASKKQRFIYVIKCGSELKIGYSVDPEARAKAIQTARAQPVTVEWMRERADAPQLEKYLHRMFSKHHIGGEWFNGDSLLVEDVRKASFGFLQYDWD